MTGAAAAHGAGAAQVVWSRTLNPYFNLAWEDYLLRLRPATPVCFLYRNAPCVVVGRNQNIWSELDARAMQRARVPVVRRRSGGGTVYHDEGNINFCFYVARSAFARNTHTELVARALRQAPVSLPTRFGEPPVQVNDRNDLYVYAREANYPAEDARRKVSGSAYKISSQHAYHHGTLLLDADLGRMRLLRRTSGAKITSRAVDSVSSPVANLRSTFPERAAQLTPQAVFEVIRDAFATQYGAAHTTLVDERDLGAAQHVNGVEQTVRNAYEDLQSWDWVYGSSPDMETLVRTDDTPWDGVRLAMSLRTERGIVSGVEVHMLESDDTTLLDAIQRLRGKRYDRLAPAPPSAVASSEPDDGAAQSASERALRAWLLRAL
ncbi:lipoate--protein ligase [Malassezia brasiliensis]|uniref:Putative lipoate-protein ligase A n=1 Tax=Malassezia brasiliensis TaxID=1821822 RepID=A0AAF0IPI1_9BASI|nr:lipoate--protein ligase [Malassezia brasiliensis]